MIETIFTTDYLELGNFLWLFLVFSSLIFLRYFLLSAVFHHAFRTSLQSVLGNRDLVKVKLDRDQAKKEIGYSFVSSVIFALIAIALIIGWQKGIVKIYTEVNSTHPWWQIPLSLLLILFLHDTYYYWLHRLFHLKSVYRKVHLVHHKSIRTSAFTSFSFHPFESVAQAIVHSIALVCLYRIVDLYDLVCHHQSPGCGSIPLRKGGSLAGKMAHWSHPPRPASPQIPGELRPVLHLLGSMDENRKRGITTQ